MSDEQLRHLIFTPFHTTILQKSGRLRLDFIAGHRSHNKNGVITGMC
jgi:hypothetical protein